MDEALLPSQHSCKWQQVASLITSVLVFVSYVMLESHVNCKVEAGRLSVARPENLAVHTAVTPENVDAASLRSVITSPKIMFGFYGFVAPPLLFQVAKGVFNFFAQLIFFIGSDLFHGFDVTRTKLGETSYRFSKLSIGFQVFGQVAFAGSCYNIALATMPWLGLDEWNMFSYLLSQHSSTVSLLVGLANNSLFVLRSQSDPQMPYDQQRVASALVFSGLILSIPVLGATLIALFPIGMAYVFLGGAILLGLQRLVGFVLCHQLPKYLVDLFTGQRDYTETASMSMFFCFSLSLGWCVLAFYDGRSWLLLLATLLEFVLPLFALFVLGYFISEEAFAADNPNSYLQRMLWAFWLSMSMVYVVTMVVPTALLAAHTEVGFFEAAPESFWGKKIIPYATYTFVYPAEHLVGVGGSYSSIVKLWFTQIMSFFS